MITLALLHPVKTIAIQNWTFTSDSTIRVGRGTNNEVVLYSAVVSRRHLEIRPSNLSWEVVSLGTNGTYLEGKRITKVTVKNGMVVRLGSSGPRIQIWTNPDDQMADLTAARQPMHSAKDEKKSQKVEKVTDLEG